MLLNEPPRSQGDVNFMLLGIPIRIHWMFWLMALVFGSSSEGPKELLIWVAALLVSILVHELGHAAVMRMYGLHPSITLYGMGGVTTHNWAQPFGVRPVLGPLEQIAISLAGPMAGFLLAGAICGGIVLSRHQLLIHFGLPFGINILPLDIIGSLLMTDLIRLILFISIFWGLVNLLPVYPLDGGQIARELLMLFSPRDGFRLSLILSVMVGVLLALVGWVLWKSIFAALLFGFLAYQSFAILQGYSGPRR